MIVGVPTRIVASSTIILAIDVRESSTVGEGGGLPAVGGGTNAVGEFVGKGVDVAAKVAGAVVGKRMARGEGDGVNERAPPAGCIRLQARLTNMKTARITIDFFMRITGRKSSALRRRSRSARKADPIGRRVWNILIASQVEWQRAVRR